jgi:FkbM family methyltransferase
MPLTRDHVVWAYRLLLDRDPESEDVIGPKLAGSRDTAELRRHLMTSAEFQDKNRDYAHTNERTIVIREIAPRLRLFVDLSDHVIGLAIVRGRYEREEIAFVRGMLRPGDVAVDAGAHIGFFTMHMADAVGPTGHVHAFEPFPSNADLLAQSIAENRFEARVTLTRAAVGDAAGEAVLAFPAETLNTGGAYVLPEGGVPLGGHRTTAVPVTPLDAAPLRRPVRFVKMDVEGAEPRILAGARRLLAEDRPAILSELHPEQLQRASGVTAEAFLAQLAALGYRAHRLEHGAVGARLDRAPTDAVTSVVLLPV